MCNDRKIIKRGQIWMANIPVGKKDSCIQQGKRPVIIISNERNNGHSTVVNIVTLTSRAKKKLPVHVILGTDFGLERESMVLCEQIMSIDTSDLLYEVAKCPEDIMEEEINIALKIQLELIKPFDYNYIDKVKFYISEALRKYKRYNDDFFIISIQNSLDELKRYCNEYGRDYRQYIDNQELLIAL